MCSNIRAAVAVLLLVVVSGCGQPLPDWGNPRPGNYVCELVHDGAWRSYRLHVPSCYDPHRPMPVVIVLHGALADARTAEKMTAFSELADREGFFAVYPNGMGVAGFLRHWNAVHGCGVARMENRDDAGFVRQCLDHLAGRLSIDADRVYVVGHSNGAMLAFRVAAEMTDRIAAVAGVAGTIGGRPTPGEPELVLSQPARPVPVILLHGSGDHTVPFYGGRPNPRFDTRTDVSFPRTVDFWTEHNRTGAADIQWLRNGRILRLSYPGGPDGADVECLVLMDWAHAWPGRQVTSKLAQDDPLRDFSAAEAIWEFLSRYRRRPAADIPAVFHASSSTVPR